MSSLVATGTCSLGWKLVIIQLTQSSVLFRKCELLKINHH